MPCGIMVGGTRRSSGITLAAEKLGGGEQRRDEKGFGRGCQAGSATRRAAKSQARRRKASHRAVS